jgi:hypothetical protein
VKDPQDEINKKFLGLEKRKYKESNHIDFDKLYDLYLGNNYTEEDIEDLWSYLEYLNEER